MDLRVGQFGENLKTLNGLVSISTTVRRDSNFSSRLQQFAMSGTAIHDPTEFHNTIDRFNLDHSLRSSAANNTIADAGDLDVSLDNDDLYNNDGQNAPNHPEVCLPTASFTGMNARTITETETFNNATAPAAAPATTALATTTTSTTSRVIATTSTAEPATVTFSAAATSNPASTTTTYASVISRTTAAANTATRPAAVANTEIRSAAPSTCEVPHDCRLKVVNRNRPPVRQIPTEETMKSFYVTPFHIEQSEEDIIEYLRETINIDKSSLKCVKLVPRNKDINELSFVSFKLSVSEDLATVINDTFYWPEGVEIREFQPKNDNVPRRIVST